MNYLLPFAGAVLIAGIVMALLTIADDNYDPSFYYDEFCEENNMEGGYLDGTVCIEYVDQNEIIAHKIYEIKGEYYFGSVKT